MKAAVERDPAGAAIRESKSEESGRAAPRPSRIEAPAEKVEDGVEGRAVLLMRVEKSFYPPHTPLYSVVCPPSQKEVGQHTVPNGACSWIFP